MPDASTGTPRLPEATRRITNLDVKKTAHLYHSLVSRVSPVVWVLIITLYLFYNNTGRAQSIRVALCFFIHQFCCSAWSVAISSVKSTRVRNKK